MPFDAIWSACRRTHFHSKGRPTWLVGLLCRSVYIQRSRSLLELANIQVVSIWSLLSTLKIASVNLFALRHVEHKNKLTKRRRWGISIINGYTYGQAGAMFNTIDPLPVLRGQYLLAHLSFTSVLLLQFTNSFYRVFQPVQHGLEFKIFAYSANVGQAVYWFSRSL